MLLFSALIHKTHQLCPQNKNKEKEFKSERERELEGNDIERKQKTKNTNDLMIHFRDEPRRVRMVFHKGEKGEVIIIFWCTETHTRKDTV